MTQQESILKHLKEGNTITPLEALNGFQCFRLAAVIHRLKDEGVDIETEIITTNTKKRIARYKLKSNQLKIV